MARYKITSLQGVELGEYEASDEYAALEAMDRDAGYADSQSVPAEVGAFAGTVQEIGADGEPTGRAKLFEADQQS